MPNQFGALLLVFLLPLICVDAKKYRVFGDDASSTSSSVNDQRLLVDVDIYNRPYALPYLLGQLERFTCPCSRCDLDLRTYRVFNTINENETSRILTEWASAMEKSGQSTFTKITIHAWAAKSTDDRANRVRDVLQRVSELDITYLAMFDSMIILLEPEKVLSTLVSKDKPLMAPLLSASKGMFTSTFYLNDQDASGYVTYKQIYERKKLGCFLIDGGIKDFYFFNFQYPQVRTAFLKEPVTDDSQQEYGTSFIALPSMLAFSRRRH